MNWELALAVGGLALGIFNAVAWWVERRDRRAELAAERMLREEEARLDRERFDMEAQDRAAREHAEITAIRGGAHRDDDDHVFEFVLRNMGPSYGKHVTAWLADGEGTPLSDAADPAPLSVNEQRAITLRGRTNALNEAVQVRLWVGWRDSHGQFRQEPSNVDVLIP